MARYMTGAINSPRHRLAGATPFKAPAVVPSEWGVVAPLYSM
jgi:hypothetical protein